MTRPRLHATLSTLLISSLVLAGCSSSNGDTDAEEIGPPDQETTEHLLDPPANGWLIESIGTNIRAGEDIEYCEVARLPGTPGETYYVNRMEVAFNEYSHHLILFTVPPGSETESQFEVGDIVPCKGAHQFGAVSALTGSQKPYQDIQYPPGIGRTVEGGQMVVINYHHLNTSTEEVWGHHAIGLHLVDKSDIVQLARTFAFLNVAIDIPARSQASFTGECTFDNDIQLWALTRHTHQWGKDFEVSFVGDDRSEEVFWRSTDFEADTNFRLRDDYGLDADTMVMKAGEGFRFTCDFDNTTDERLQFGLGALDEMCILFGAYWDVTPGDEAPPQSCVIATADENGFGQGTRYDVPGFD